MNPKPNENWIKCPACKSEFRTIGRVHCKNDLLPLDQNEIINMAIASNNIPPMRVLATFADRNNWVQLYDGKSIDYTAKKCEWAFIGPMRPPYELAQAALPNIKAP